MKREVLRLALPLLASALLGLTACARDPDAIRPAPPTGPAHERMRAGDVSRRRGDVEAALTEYRRAIERDPAAVRPHLRYTRAMLDQGRGAALRREYEMRAAAPAATDAERTMAERLRTNGASSQLRRVYTAAADRAPRSPWWRLALAEVETMEAEAWNGKRLDALDRGDREGEQTAIDQTRGAMHRAGRAIERAGALAPRLAEVHLYRGYLRAIEGDMHRSEEDRAASFEAARNAFATAVIMDRDLVEAWAGLGSIEFEREELRASLIAWIEAVQRAPADGELRVGLGVVLHEIGRLPEAAEQYEQAARLLTFDAQPLIRLGDALADARHYDRALAAYERALERDSQAVEAHYKIGSVLEYRNRLREARAAYERYVAQDGARADIAKRRIERLLRAEQR